MTAALTTTPLTGVHVEAATVAAEVSCALAVAASAGLTSNRGECAASSSHHIVILTRGVGEPTEHTLLLLHELLLLLHGVMRGVRVVVVRVVRVVVLIGVDEHRGQVTLTRTRRTTVPTVVTTMAVIVPTVATSSAELQSGTIER